MPAFPQTMAECNGGITEILDFNPCSVGLTKRELIAAMAMQGMLSNPKLDIESTPAETIAQDAIVQADILLAVLSKPQP